MAIPWRSMSLGATAVCWIISIPWALYDWHNGQVPFEAATGFLLGLVSLMGYFYGPESKTGQNTATSQAPVGNVSHTTNASNGGVAIGGDVRDSQIHTQIYHQIILPPKAQPPLYQLPDLPKPGDLPDHGDLPPGSLLPFLPNAVFTGRHEDLIELAKALLHSKAKGVGLTQSATVTTGYGGVGKTQLAVEFCYRYGRFFHGVHWIHADQDIPSEIAACGSAMGLQGWPEKVLDQVALTLKAWSDGGPRLVVMDNAIDEVGVQTWMPRLSHCRFLITTRQSEWPPDMGFEIWALDVLKPGQSRELLRKLASRMKDVPDGSLDKITERLGYLPLALDLAGRYLADRPDLSPEDYLKALEGQSNALDHTSMNDWVKYNPTQHATSLAATFALSWDWLGDDKSDVLAKQIFRACGYCAPNTPIPRELLRKAMSSEGSDEMLDLALKRLSNLGLVIPTDGGSVLHPLLAEFARLRDIEPSVLPELAKALIGLVSQANKSGLPEQMRPLKEHLRSVAQAAEDAELRLAGILWNELGYHLWTIAEYEGAKRHFERALKIDEKVYGLDHPHIAIRVNNLGMILQDLGDLEGAKEYLERALKIDEKAYGPDHPNVAIRVNNLGLVLQGLGDLEGAKKRFERALRIDEKAYGPDHYEVATRINNLGMVLKDLGDFEGAKKHFERALKIDENIYGPDHPNVARDANNLGMALKSIGDPKDAKKYLERALRIDEKVYSKDHPSVARDINNLGLVLRDLGDIEGARICFKRALKIFRYRLGENHTNTKLVQRNLELLK